jgi:hypothetical protein
VNTLLPRNAKLRQEFFEKSWKFLSGTMASLVRSDKAEVRWHSFAAKSQVLCRKLKTARSVLDGTEKISAHLAARNPPLAPGAMGMSHVRCSTSA